MLEYLGDAELLTLHDLQVAQGNNDEQRPNVEWASYIFPLSTAKQTVTAINSLIKVAASNSYVKTSARLRSISIEKADAIAAKPQA